MTAVDRAEERGHVMESWGDNDGRDVWVCAACGATLLRDDLNPFGWGTSLDRDCGLVAA